MNDYEQLKDVAEKLDRRKQELEFDMRAIQRELKKIEKLKILLAFKVGGGVVSQEMINGIEK